MTWGGVSQWGLIIFLIVLWFPKLRNTWDVRGWSSVGSNSCRAGGRGEATIWDALHGTRPWCKPQWCHKKENDSCCIPPVESWTRYAIKFNYRKQVAGFGVDPWSPRRSTSSATDKVNVRDSFVGVWDQRTPISFARVHKPVGNLVFFQISLRRQCPFLFFRRAKWIYKDTLL